MRNKYLWIVVVLLILSFGVGRLSAAGGTLDAPALPGSTSSYTLEDIYNRLDTGAAGSQSTFTEPSSGPTAGTGHTLDEITALAPAADNTNGAVPGDVLTGKTYWSLRTDGTWGTQSGTMPNRGAVVYTPGTTNQTVADGYHNGSGYVVGDGDLATGNIRAGVNIFGVAGNSNVVNTSSGDAAAGDILNGKKAWVDGSELTGTYPFAPVSKTGQTASYATRDDGDLERGVVWPSPRLTDNGNGTVTDNLTGLIWLRHASCSGTKIWSDAVSWANGLYDGCTNCGGTNNDCSLSDGSSAGDWRLPNVNELQSLIDYGRDNTALPSGHTFYAVLTNFWSSTTGAWNTSVAWYVYMVTGVRNANLKTTAYYAWPVRGGQ